MPKKGEHIYKRKDGRWEGRYRNGTDKKGKAVYRSVYGSNYSEVKKKLSVCKKSNEPIEVRQGKSPFFREVVSLWQKANNSRYKGATEMKYDKLIDNHILPALGNCKLIEINTVLLADFMNDKLQNGRIDRNGGLSPSYVRTIILDCNNCLLIMTYFLF